MCIHPSVAEDSAWMRRYDRALQATLNAAPVAKTAWEAQRWHGNVRLQYRSQEHFEQLAEAFSMMTEWRDGVPRAAYHGVVSRHATYFNATLPCAVRVPVQTHIEGGQSWRDAGEVHTMGDGRKSFYP